MYIQETKLLIDVAYDFQGIFHNIGSQALMILIHHRIGFKYVHAVALNESFVKIFKNIFPKMLTEIHLEKLQEARGNLA